MWLKGLTNFLRWKLRFAYSAFKRDDMTQGHQLIRELITPCVHLVIYIPCSCVDSTSYSLEDCRESNGKPLSELYKIHVIEPT